MVKNFQFDQSLCLETCKIFYQKINGKTFYKILIPSLPTLSPFSFQFLSPSLTLLLSLSQTLTSQTGETSNNTLQRQHPPATDHRWCHTPYQIWSSSSASKSPFKTKIEETRIIHQIVLQSPPALRFSSWVYGGQIVAELLLVGWIAVVSGWFLCW